MITREHDRTILVPIGKKSIERARKKGELKADTIPILDRAGRSLNRANSLSITPLKTSPFKGTRLSIPAAAPARLGGPSCTRALFFFTDGRPVIPGHLPHRAAEHFRLSRAFDIPVQG